MAWGEEKFSYQPALDGVRGLAVAFVLAFHLGVPWATGGYLGVSVFFTLSGFLITSLLLGEHEQSGRIDIGAFYLRRARRLLPASLLCIGGVTVLLATGVLQRTGARSEVFSATFEAANWHALLAGRSYADLFLAPSALAHFWSLAIEEQFYVLWPVSFAGIAALAARRRGRVSLSRALVLLFVVFAVASPLTAYWWSADAAYYASWARFGEILAGAALASLLARRELPAGLARLAPPCLAVIVALCVITPAGSGWAYSGGLPLFALVSAGLIAGLQVDGPVRSLLAWRPLVGLGVISYGVYLFHWPVFVVLDEQRTGMDGWPLGLVRLAVTLAVALTVYLILEQPVRAGVLLAQPSRFVMSAGTAVAVVAIAVALTVPDLGTHGGSRPALLAASQPTAAGAIAAPPAPKTVAVIGDSVPDWLLRDAAPSYRRSDFVVVNDAHEGCDGAVDEPLAQGAHGEELRRGPQCQAWPDAYPALVEDPTHAVDVALLIVGQAPVLSHMIDGRWVHPCEDMQWYSSDVTARIQFLKQHVPSVFVVLPSWADNSISLYVPSDHEARYACVRDQLQLAARRSGVPTIDLADVLCPGGPNHVCLGYRQRDGLHVDPNRASMVLNWMLDQLPGATTASGLSHVS